jgi:exonuclease SbcC
MHVTRVELENIKSYERAEFVFAPGTTAIVGPNGAGKTTILEAIAWALFDVLGYSKDDFARRGAKKGVVRVTFESALDEREFVVYRDTGTGYYVVDPLLNTRLAEKKQDVAAFLRQHLGIEPGTDLRALFESAIGVPQGTLTADFLKPASQRKLAFDRLLKVEEYREGAQRLGETTRLIGERVAAARERIGRAEGTLARYDEIVAEHKSVAARVEELNAAHSSLQQETETRTHAVGLLDEAEQRVAETRALADRYGVEREALERRLVDLRAELDAALSARARQQATEAAHNAHLTALTELQRLETVRAERDELRQEAERAARQIVQAEADVRRLTDALDAAARARQALAEIEVEVGKQEELERERERLRELRAQALAAQARLKRLDAELTDLRAQHTQTKEALRQAEGARVLAVEVPRLESERLQFETDLSKAEQDATARKHLTSQRDELTREIKRLQSTITTLERKTRDLEKRAAGAERAAELEATERTLTDQIAQLRAEIARDEQIQEEVKGGVCPILRERCTSFSAGQTFADYFGDTLANNRTQLAQAQTQATRIGQEVRAAREAGVAFGLLNRERTQLAHERELLGARERDLAPLEQKLSALTGDRQTLEELRNKLMGLDGELIAAREAALRYAELEPLRQRLTEIEVEGKRKKEERAELAAAASAVETLADDIAALERNLRALNDPRGQAVRLRAEAERAATLETEAQTARAALKSLNKQRQTLDAQLQRFKDFDAQWMATGAERDHTAGAHHEYIASAALAATVAPREEAVTRTTAEVARATSAAESAQRAHDEAAARYDRARHTTERDALTLVRQQAATVGAQLEAAEERAASLSTEIARLDEVRATLRAEFRAKERLQGLAEATDFIRDTLKAAGPLVTESYLYNITIEANQLFREITGEAGRALRWTRDYEIVVEEGGYERSFPNLSGGEQMAAALAVRLALLKQLSDIRIAFFDEPTVNMDAERRERLAQQIGQVRHFTQLFVISHDDTFEEAVDHVKHIPADNLAQGATA